MPNNRERILAFLETPDLDLEDDAGARISKTDGIIQMSEDLTRIDPREAFAHTPKFSRILKIWQGEF
jgi:hypothetical protein